MFSDLFRQATCGDERYPYQERLAVDGETLPFLLDVPTGLGKTAAAILAWVWRRRFAPEDVRNRTPRRLVYCLPMRVLVEQTFTEAVRWLDRLGLLAGTACWTSTESTEFGELPAKSAELMVATNGGTRSYLPRPEANVANTGWAARNGVQGDMAIAVHLLMGGEERTDWALWPERDAVLIGTQDMLLSRALNRGYAARRTRWPVEFGLLNSDCLWVFDEVQLIGPGLATGLQLEAFRQPEIDGKGYFGTERPCVSWYMSATASRRMLASREWRNGDGDRRPDDFVFELSSEERADASGNLGRRRLATKQLECQLTWTFRDAEAATRIWNRHSTMLAVLSHAPQAVPRRTLVICNTVDRARALHAALGEDEHRNPSTNVVLLHSRFRPRDRAREQGRLKPPLDALAGQIVVATQVVEAGVDLSAAVLWTELATLPSIVQRLGRLNRGGEFGHAGETTWKWIPTAVLVAPPLPTLSLKPTNEDRKKHERDTTKAYLPYDRSECQVAQQALHGVVDVSPANLEVQLRQDLDQTLRPPDYSLQRHELPDFFDTDSNLSLGYTDVSPFIRGLDPETDVYVAWRMWSEESPPFGFDIGRDEICQVPIWGVIGKNGLSSWSTGFVWQGRDREWQPATRDNVLPGATLLLPVTAGGYDDRIGWTGRSADNAHLTDLYDPWPLPTNEDLLSELEVGWQNIPSHTADVLKRASDVLDELGTVDPEIRAAIVEAVRWHDYGKAVRRWQAATRLVAWNAGLTWPRGIAPLAKFSFKESPLLVGVTGLDLRRVIWQLKRTFAPRLRHEVASALALRQHHRRDGGEPTPIELLAEYLVMSHHGYVRKVLRDELPRHPTRHRRRTDAVRGIADGTCIRGLLLHDESLLETTALYIACRQMGRSADGSESWTQSVLRLLDHFGPFRLAYYEAIVRAADRRASAQPSPSTNVITATPRQRAGEPAGASLAGIQS